MKLRFVILILLLGKLANGFALPSERMVWDGQFLVERSIEDEDGNILRTLKFDYENGFLIKQTLIGCLTGTSSEPESYSIYYTYSDGRLVKRAEDNGNEIIYNYDSEGHLISAINGHAKKKLVFYPSLKQPEMLIEYLFDSETGQEQLIQRVENCYSDDAKLLYQEFFNRDDISLGSLSFQYDAFNHQVGQFDNQGNGINRIYDVDGNCLSTIEYKKNEVVNQVINTYDDNQLPILTEERSTTGKLIPKLHEYDAAGRCIAILDALGNRTEYRYDPFGHIVEIIYPMVLNCDDQAYHPTQKWEYDVLGRVKSYTDLRGDKLVVSYTCRGQPTSIQYADGSYDRHEYLLDGSPVATISRTQETPILFSPQIENDSNAHIEIVQDLFGQHVLQSTNADIQGNSTILTLDVLGRISHVLKKNCFDEITLDQENRYDGVGNKTLEKNLLRKPNGQEYTVINRWEYGPNGRLERAFEAFGLPEQKVTSYHYDSEGNLSYYINPNGVEVHYEYDNHKLSRLWSSDHTIDYQIHYLDDEIASVEDLIQGQNSTRDYTTEKYLTQEILGNGLSIAYHYDEEGKRTSLHLPDGSGFQYEWDELSIKSIQRISADGKILYTHDEDHLINDLGEYSLITDEQGYCKEIISPYWAEIIPEGSYDNEHILYCTTISDSQGTETYRYQYDDRNRLIHEEGLDYQYDTLGNRYHSDEKYNSLCQLLQKENTVYRYDLNGNLAAKDSTQLYYDALNRLTDVVTSDGKKYHYTYDYFHRRLSKTLIIDDKIVDQELYLYDGQKEIGSLNSEGKVKELRMLAPGIGAEIAATVAVELDGIPYAAINDHRGSIACIVSLQKQPFETYRFSAFGQEETTHYQNPWRFASKRYDPETGFINFGKRYYNPDTGLWITPDPIESVNRYQFVDNNPITLTDLYGLFSFPTSWQSVLQNCDNVLCKVSDFLGNTDHYVRTHLSFETQMQPTVDQIANAIFGETWLVLMGYHNEDADVGVIGKGELNDKVRVTSINGILNIKSWAEENAELFSKTHSNINVHYIYRPTRGWTHDIIKSGFVKFGYASQESRMLARTWKQLIQEMGGTTSGGIIIHYAHSIGGADTAIARQFLTPEEQKMIRVISLGSPMMIPHEGFHSVVNYGNLGDGVFYLAFLSHIRNFFTGNHNVIYLDSYWGVPFIDHLLGSGTYKTLIETLGREFAEEFLKNQSQ